MLVNYSNSVILRLRGVWLLLSPQLLWRPPAPSVGAREAPGLHCRTLLLPGSPCGAETTLCVTLKQELMFFRKIFCHACLASENCFTGVRAQPFWRRYRSLGCFIFEKELLYGIE